MNLFELFVKIGVDDQASDKISGLSSKLGKGLQTAAKVGTAAMAAIGTATVAAGTAFANNIKQTAEYADNIDKMSQKMGLSAQAYQEWDFIMQHSGTSMEALKAGMKTLANAVESGNDAFERLGITQEEIATMNQEELFARTLEGLQGVTDETERTYLAGQLLGRGATELGALLNTSAEDVEAMRQQAHDLGGVMSDEAVKAGAAFQDSLQNLGVATSSLGKNLSAQFLPSVTSMMDGLSALITGDESGFGLIETGINDFIDNLANELPKFLELGAKIVENLATAILDNLPKLFESGVSIITELATSAIGMLPQIVALGLDLIVSLANGIAENLPELIPTIVDVILQIVDTLTDPETLSSLIDASIAIVIALANGIIDSLPKLLEKAPEIISNLVTAIVNNVPKLLEAALSMILTLVGGIVDNLPQIGEAALEIISALLNGLGDLAEKMWDVGVNAVKGIWEGIESMADWLWQKVSGFFDGIVGGIKDFLGIHSPSKVFASIGENMALGLGEGWDDEYGNIKRGITSGLDFGTASVGFADSGIGISSAAIVNGLGEGKQSGGSFTFNLMFPDMTKFASYVFDPLTGYAQANGTPILNPIT